MIVGARKRRAEVGSRVKLHVVAYELEGGLWAFTVCDVGNRPLVRSATHGDEIGRPFGVMNAELGMLLSVKLTREGSRLVRVDERWDVAVRVVGGNDELPYRVS